MGAPLRPAGRQPGRPPLRGCVGRISEVARCSRRFRRPARRPRAWAPPHPPKAVAGPPECSPVARAWHRSSDSSPRQLGRNSRLTDETPTASVANWASKATSERSVPTMSDVDVLNGTLASEHLGIAAYDAALGSGLLDEPTADVA